MARQGFEPEIVSTRTGAEIMLHRCPFASAALADRATICALHLGIAEGLTAGTGWRVNGLTAFDPRNAECRLRLQDTVDGHAPHWTATVTLRGKVRSR